MLQIQGKLPDDLKKELEPVPSYCRKSLLFVLNEVKTYLVSGVGDIQKLQQGTDQAIKLLQQFEGENYHGTRGKKCGGISGTQLSDTSSFVAHR